MAISTINSLSRRRVDEPHTEEFVAMVSNEALTHVTIHSDRICGRQLRAVDLVQLGRGARQAVNLYKKRP